MPVSWQLTLEVLIKLTELRYENKMWGKNEKKSIIAKHCDIHHLNFEVRYIAI